MKDKNSKSELIDSIARKMKFIGSYRYFDQDDLEKKTVDELQKRDSMFSHVVRVHSNPLYQKITLALYRGQMDPRWKPFVSGLKQTAKCGTFRERQIKKALIQHLTKSSLLLNYINTLHILALENYTERSQDTLPLIFDLSNANIKIITTFKKYDGLYLLERQGLSFTYGEDFFIKVLVQKLRSDEKYEYDVDLKKRWIKDQNEKDRDPAPAAPKKVNEIFGSIAKYNNLNLLDYGTIFFKTFFVGSKLFSVNNG